MHVGATHSALSTMYPAASAMVRFPDTLTFMVPEGATTYGYVAEGTVIAHVKDIGEVNLPTGVVFSLPSGTVLTSDEQPALIWAVTRLGYINPFTVVAPEVRGRLTYIDGCSDSLLIFPQRLGDGSLNLLYFPHDIYQSRHTHPSIRVGYVLSGKGKAHWIDQSTGEEKERDLQPGDSFLLDAHTQHNFSTTDSHMRILAYHPDGDWGPEDHNHTMLNRTYRKS